MSLFESKPTERECAKAARGEPSEVWQLRPLVKQLRMALKVAINTVECASLDKDGAELPWYVGAKAALRDSEEFDV